MPFWPSMNRTPLPAICRCRRIDPQPNEFHEEERHKIDIRRCKGKELAKLKATTIYCRWRSRIPTSCCYALQRTPRAHTCESCRVRVSESRRRVPQMLRARVGERRKCCVRVRARGAERALASLMRELCVCACVRRDARCVRFHSE